MRREAEGYRRQTDLNSWSPLRFTVSLPRLTKWVTHGRVPSLTQPTDLLNIFIKVQALPSHPPSIFPFRLAAFWLRCANKHDCWCRWGWTRWMIAVVSVNGYCVFIGVVFDIKGPILLVLA